AVAQPGNANPLGSTVTAQGLEDERTQRKHAEAIEDPLVQEVVRSLGGKVSKISLIED
ncbi:MAG: hypothetical protein ACI91F_003239, partial [Candidatus Binatia bacterium]